MIDRIGPESSSSRTPTTRPSPPTGHGSPSTRPGPGSGGSGRGCPRAQPPAGDERCFRGPRPPAAALVARRATIVFQNMERTKFDVRVVDLATQKLRGSPTTVSGPPSRLVAFRALHLLLVLPQRRDEPLAHRGVPGRQAPRRSATGHDGRGAGPRARALAGRPALVFAILRQNADSGPFPSIRRRGADGGPVELIATNARTAEARGPRTAGTSRSTRIAAAR